jgi:hypothetical protein
VVNSEYLCSSISIFIKLVKGNSPRISAPMSHTALDEFPDFKIEDLPVLAVLPSENPSLKLAREFPQVHVESKVARSFRHLRFDGPIQYGQQCPASIIFSPHAIDVRMDLLTFHRLQTQLSQFQVSRCLP